MPKIFTTQLAQHLAQNGYNAVLQGTSIGMPTNIRFFQVTRQTAVGTHNKGGIRMGGQRLHNVYCKAFQHLNSDSFFVNQHDAVALCTRLKIVPPRPNLYREI